LFVFNEKGKAVFLAFADRFSYICSSFVEGQVYV